MIRSLSSAVSALRNHQAFLDVISTNISNVNTVGYKSSRVSFQDLLSQTIKLGRPADADSGGTNPMQIGLGMQLGGVTTIFSQGSLQATGRTTDLAIQGDGFFVFQSGTERSYSRDGSIDVGLSGALVNTTSGTLVLGWQADDSGVVSTAGEIGAIQVPYGTGEARSTSEVTFEGNLNLNHYLGTEATVTDTVEDFTTSEVTSGKTQLATDSYYVEIQNEDGTLSGETTVGTTVTAFAASSVASGQTQLAADTYHVETQDAGGGSWEFRVVDDTGTAVSIYDAATDDGSTFSSDWQDVGDTLTNYADGVVDTERGLTISLGTAEATYVACSNGGGNDAEVTYAPGSMQFRMVDSDGDAVSIYDTATDDGTTFSSDWQDVGDMLTNYTDGAVDTGLGLTIDFDIVEGDFLAGTMASGAASVAYINGAGAAISSSVGVYDSLGELHSLSLSFVRTGVSTWSYTLTESDDSLSLTSGTTGSVTFDENGVCTSTNPIIGIDYTNGATDSTVTLDLGTLTQLSGASTVNPASQDGLAAGTLVDFSINEYGQVLGLFSNGLSQMIGQIAVASFNNPAGLLRMGQNLFGVAPNSGLAQVGVAGAGKRGTISSGFLEMSNVDLAREFTDMIVAQRGFQANSRVVSTSDDILQEVVNLKR